MTNFFIVISCPSTYHSQDVQMAAFRKKHDEEMVNFCSLFGSAILTKSLEIFQGKQEKYIAQLRLDSQREMVSFYLSFSFRSQSRYSYRKSNTNYYVLNSNAKMYVGALFKSLALTSVQFEHDNELRILRKRLEQVGFTFPCIRCLS
jgi:hypothetical protein